MAISHIIDEPDRWRIVFEIDRRRRVFVALLPKDVNIGDVAVFATTITTIMRRKLTELAQQKGNHIDGKAEGASEGAFPREDAAGEGEKKTDPEIGGPKGGSDPKAS